MKKYKLIIFDRDNTLIKDVNGYVFKVDELEWFEGVQNMLWRIKLAGIKVAIATNQAGVARGLYSEADVNKLHDYMNSAAGVNGAIDLFRYCPHHPEGIIEPYKLNCSFRKPESGMILDIIASFNVEAHEAIIFGDSESDCISGMKAGIDFELVQPGNIVNSVLIRAGI